MRILYLDCSAGIAGDMLLGALVDAGASTEYIRDQLERIDMHGWDLTFEEIERGGLRSLKAKVNVDEELGRTNEQVKNLVESAGLDAPVAGGALEIFALMAEAEARVHGTDIADTHFHEVGTTDALVDVVGCIAALESLDIDRVVASRVAVGSGRAKSAHGLLPIPAPATIDILARANAPILSGGDGELATPTGAALVATLADDFKGLPEMTPLAIGSGAGSRERDVPNIVRAIVGHEEGDPDEQRVVVEANIDDMVPELFPHVIERLLEEGADDAWVTPIVMKKGRPAFTLSALVTSAGEPAIARVFFTETTTLGLRTRPVDKRSLARDWVLVQVEGSPVQVKIGHFEGKVTSVAPEYDDAVAAARSSGIPLKDVYRIAVEAAQDELRATRP